MRLMTDEHERWGEFAARLAGPEGCDFRFDADGRLKWKCAGGIDKSRAVRILEQMGGDIDIPGSVADFEEHGGFCDCEIILNVVERQHDLRSECGVGQANCDECRELAALPPF